MRVNVNVVSVPEIDPCPETWDIPHDGVNPQHVIDKYNETLKPGEQPRIALNYELEVLCICPNAFTVFSIEEVKNDIEFSSDASFIEFLEHPTPGAIYGLNHPQYTLAVLVIGGYGEHFGLKADIPDCEPGTCSACNADAEQMEWHDGRWHCTECGQDQ